MQVLGGLGMFLLGMSLMTDGLKALAGGSVRKVLTRFTRSPTSGAITGAVTTAVVQSSSITVITAVGFVGAKLLTFPEALGVIFGANVGTTITGWLVALIGFKLSLDEAMLPLVFVGALIHLFGRNRLGKIGFALAGFGLVFVGISMLQGGMAGAQHLVSPESFPSDSISGRLLLVLIGVAITLVTQSSSAGVATAITAVSVGAISFPQAAAMVIGMDVGTTVTAALATVGGDTAVRRTGLAHVIYNVLTGIVAFGLLSPYYWALDGLSSGLLQRDPELALVGFHTLFNGLGVLLVLPFAGHFARLIERLFPEDESSIVRHLTTNLQKDTVQALAAVHRALSECMLRLLGGLTKYLDGGHEKALVALLPDVQSAMTTIETYLLRVHTTEEVGPVNDAHLEVLHAVAHLKLLVEQCEDPEKRALYVESNEARNVAIQAFGSVADSLGDEAEAETAESTSLAEEFASLSDKIQAARHRVLMIAATGTQAVAETESRLESLRWLEELGSHVRRVHVHLQRFPAATGMRVGPERAALTASQAS